jgi:hypothetical protein
LKLCSAILPRDDRKFFDKLKNIVIDPQEKVGYAEKTPISTLIRMMSEARDKRRLTEERGSAGYAPQNFWSSRLMPMCHLGCTGEGARICVLRVTTPTLGRLEPPSFLDAFSPVSRTASLAVPL